jgi:hypothetical protein
VIKLRSWKTGRKQTRAVIHADWTDQMKRPTYVSVSFDKNNFNEEEKPLIEGDPGDVAYVMNGIAQIAWDSGWRPSGLAETVMSVVRNYKQPKA